MRSGYWSLLKGEWLRPGRVDKSFTEAELAAEAKWDDKRYRAAGELFLNVSVEQRTYLAGMERDPALMWKTLESVHVQKCPGMRFNAYDNLFSIAK